MPVGEDSARVSDANVNTEEKSKLTVAIRTPDPKYLQPVKDRTKEASNVGVSAARARAKGRPRTHLAKLKMLFLMWK